MKINKTPKDKSRFDQQIHLKQPFFIKNCWRYKQQVLKKTSKKWFCDYFCQAWKKILPTHYKFNDNEKELIINKVIMCTQWRLLKIKFQNKIFLWFIFKMLRKKSVCKNEAKLALIVPLEIALTACNFS